MRVVLVWCKSVVCFVEVVGYDVVPGEFGRKVAGVDEYGVGREV